MGPGGGVLPGSAARQVRARRPLARLQGGRLQPSATPIHRSARRDHRPGRRRRPRPALLPARDRLVLLRPERRFLADLRGQPRLRGQPLLHRLRRLLPGLLPVGHVLAQRARHRPVRGDHGTLPPQRPDGDRRVERVVYLRGHRGLTAGAQGRLVRPLHSALLRPRDRATQLGRDAHPAAPLVLRGHADPPTALAQPDALGQLPRQPSHRRPAPRLPDGVARLVPRPPDAGLQPRCCWPSPACWSPIPASRSRR